MCQTPPAIQMQAYPDVATNNIFEVIDTDNPTFTTKWCFQQITKNNQLG